MRIATFWGVRRSLRIAALIAVVALCASAVALASSPKPRAQATSGVAYAGVTHSEGSNLFVAGEFKDKVLGRGAIVYITQVTGGDQPSTVHVNASKITVYTTKGSFTGKGEADQTFNSDGTSTISNGTFDLPKGTGAYAGKSFNGKFDGTFTDGVYTFNYTAKIK
jgi:hypothetical protein